MAKLGRKAPPIPADEARQITATLLDQAFARELPQPQFPDFPRLGLTAFTRLPPLLAYLDW